MKVKPVLACRRKPPRTHCTQGHAITGHNARPGRLDSPSTCRACHVATTWARRHNLFYDDPRVIEHAEQLLAKYREMTS